MAQQSCGASIQACAMRVAVLEQDGIPLPGTKNLYTTDALTKLDATPNYTKGVDLEVLNGCGAPSLIYKDFDRFKRYDLALELINLDPEIENMLVGGELFTQGGFAVGGTGPDIAVFERPYGVSLELWSKHIVGGDVDPVWPYIHWVFPRSYWTADKTSLMNGPMPRAFNGFTSRNLNWFNGPSNDWTFASDRSMAWAFTRTLPPVTCGATAITGT